MTGCQILITNNVSCNVQSQLVGKYIFCIHLGGGGRSCQCAFFRHNCANIHNINHVEFVVRTTPSFSNQHCMNLETRGVVAVVDDRYHDLDNGGLSTMTLGQMFGAHN